MREARPNPTNHPWIYYWNVTQMEINRNIHNYVRDQKNYFAVSLQYVNDYLKIYLLWLVGNASPAHSQWCIRPCMIPRTTPESSTGMSLQLETNCDIHNHIHDQKKNFILLWLVGWMHPQHPQWCIRPWGGGKSTPRPLFLLPFRDR